MHYKRAGQGTAVLLLHGSASSLHGFERVAALLSASFDVIRPDLPGFGLTGPRADRDYRVRTVTARVSATDGVEEITARYLVGADGGASAVRTKLGIGFAGSTDEQDRMLIVDAAVTGLSRDRWHFWPGLRGRFVGACPLPHSDLFQWMIRLAPNEKPPRDLADPVAHPQPTHRAARPPVEIGVPAQHSPG